MPLPAVKDSGRARLLITVYLAGIAIAWSAGSVERGCGFPAFPIWMWQSINRGASFLQIVMSFIYYVPYATVFGLAGAAIGLIVGFVFRTHFDQRFIKASRFVTPILLAAAYFVARNVGPENMGSCNI
jgi:hypothetical protein